MNGPGVYDEICTAVRCHTEAQVAVVIVLGGNRGSGFSVRARTTAAGQAAARLPTILESIAAQMRVEQADKKRVPPVNVKRERS